MEMFLFNNRYQKLERNAEIQHKGDRKETTS
jgi:hypothetical protein